MKRRAIESDGQEDQVAVGGQDYRGHAADDAALAGTSANSTPRGPGSETDRGIPTVRSVELGGLLDIALSPKFAQDRLVYMKYSKQTDKGVATPVASGRWDGTTLVDTKIFLPDRIRLRFFKWDVKTQAPEAIDRLDSFHTTEIGRPI